MPDIQSTIFDVPKVRRIKALTPNQRKIISLISAGLTQTDVAKRLNFSRAYINQIIKKLETDGMVKRVQTQEYQRRRPYTYFYEVAPELKMPGLMLTPYRVHLIRRKFAIISQSDKIVTDPRTSFSKSWKMRGGLWYKFWYEGKSGYPHVTIDVTPKTLVAYVDKGQKISAVSMKQAEEIGWYAIYQAKESFILEQDRFGNRMEIERVGQQIGKCHAGLVMNNDGPFPPADPVTKGLWDDRSVGPNQHETEGHTDHKMLTEAEAGLMAAIELKESVPAAMLEINKKLDPLFSQVSQVQAILQGGITISQQHENMLAFMTKVLDEMASIRKENADLKAALKLNQ